MKEQSLKINSFSGIVLLVSVLSMAVLLIVATLPALAFAQAGQTEGYAGILSPQPYSAPADTDYGWFERFRMDNFGPETDPVLQQALGTQLSLQTEGEWSYTSYESFAVAFSTTLPTITIVEYGQSSTYGQETETQDAYYFNHLHYLKDLQPNTTYHYRLVAQAKDGRQIASEDRVFTTRAMTSDVIRIPEDMPGGAPFALTQPNKTYLLTQDIEADGTFAKIFASNVTLDLGGHTAVYDNASGEKSSGVAGILHGEDMWHRTNIKIFNGAVKQGKRGSSWSSPVELTQFGFFDGNEIGGVTVDYYGDNTMGFYLNGWESLHHNVLVDRGTVIGNRHIGLQAVRPGDGKLKSATYNSFRRFRHQGILGGQEVYGNELYCDSYDTNSFILSPDPYTEVYGNKLFGVGYMPVGLNSATDCYMHDNIIYLHGTANRQRSDEYSRLSGIAGINLRLYNPQIDGYDPNVGDPVENLRYENNTVILKPWEYCNIARGLWFMVGDRSTNTVFKDNVVKVEALSDHLYDGWRWDMVVTCVDLNGGHHPDDYDRLPPVTLLEGNTFITNVCFISFGSLYGSGNNNVLFDRTRLEKLDHHTANYLPFTIAYWDWESNANKMINTSAGPGVDMAVDPHYYGSAKSDLTIWDTGTLHFVDQYGQPVANASVGIEVSGSWTYKSTNGRDIPPGNLPDAYDPRYALTVVTDASGVAEADFLEISHFMRKPEVAERVDYSLAVFSADGYQNASATMGEIKAGAQIVMQKNSAPAVPAEYKFNYKGKQGASFEDSFAVPSSGTATVTLSGMDGKTTATVRIIASNGMEVYSGAFTANGSKSFNIAAGNYTAITKIDKANGNTTFSVGISVAPGGAPPRTAPTVRLVGSSQIILHLGGSPYIEQGVTATDTVDATGALTIDITSSVDTSAPGEYAVQYTVTNSAGLSTAVTRSVSVIAPQMVTVSGKSYQFSPKGKQGDSFTYGIATASGSASLAVTVPSKTTATVTVTSLAGETVFAETFSATATRSFPVQAGDYTVKLAINSANGNASLGLGVTTPGGEELMFLKPEIPM